MERPSSEQELVKLGGRVVVSKKSRPPSYSDSFFFLPPDHSVDAASLSSYTVLAESVAAVPSPPRGEVGCGGGWGVSEEVLGKYGL